MASMAFETIILEPKRHSRQPCGERITLRLDDQHVKRASDLFKALADPTRLHILDALTRRSGLVCACDFDGAVGLPDERSGQRPKQSTISHHLKVLRDVGLIGYKKRSLWVYYYVHRERLAEVQSYFNTLR